MADVKDPKIAEGEIICLTSRLPFHTSSYHIPALTIAYDKVRDDKDDLTWLLLDYEVSVPRS